MPEPLNALALFDRSPNPYMVLDRSLRYVAANQAYLRVTASRLEDLLGKYVFDLFPNDPDDPANEPAQLLRGSLERVLATGRQDTLALIPYRVPSQRDDGEVVVEERFWSATHTPIPDERGEVAFILQHTVDVTELKRLEQAAKGAERNVLIEAGVLSRAQAVQEANRSLEAERFRMIAMFEQAPGFVCFLRGREQRFELANPAYLQLVGRDDILGKPVRQALPELEGQGFYELLDRVFTSGEPFVGRGMAAQLRRTAGAPLEEVYLDFVYQPIRGADGAVSGILVQGQDITEQRRAEAAREQLLEQAAQSARENERLYRAAQQSEAQFRTVAETMPQLVWTTRPDGYHDYFNQRWYDYTGLRRGETDGEGWQNPFHPDDLVEADRRWRHSLQTGEPYDVEYRCRRHDGEWRWFLGRALPVRDAQGQIVQWFGTCTDIDEQRRAADTQRYFGEVSRELARSRDLGTSLQTVARLAVPRIADWCAIDLLEDDGALERVAVAHQDPEKVALANELQRRYPPELSRPDGVGEVLRSGKSEWRSEIPPSVYDALAHDPERLRLVRGLGLKSYIVAAVRARDRVVGAITFVQSESGRHYTAADVQVAEEVAARTGLAIENARLFGALERSSAEVRLLNADLERRVAERTAELEETNRELESFSYSVSHDLRAPLRHITGFAQMLERRAGDRLDEKARGYLTTISEAAQQGGRLVDDLLSFSRMGRAELRRSRVDLAAVVDEARTELAPEVQGRAVEWKVGALPEVRADPAMVKLAVKNLLSNAVKYTGPKPAAQIEVFAHERPSEVEVVVRDNGVGFEMRYVDKLFGVFQRLHTAEQFEGTGIGLANVRRIVSRHGGRTWAEGEVGKGATFHFTLPTAAPEKEHRHG